ncbi:MAG: hypothetical protein LBG60_17185, partial [Bifidobacteriaceae bacterium]|nr:hypothetical protein [Bifidobacteriaceae bacterium]
MTVGPPAVKVPEDGPAFRDLGLARKGLGPLAAEWWAPGRRGREARTELVRAALRRAWDQAVAADPFGPGAR